MLSRIVYVVGVSDNPVKIGIADDMARRLSSLQSGNPDPLQIFSARPFPYRIAASVETTAHALLKAHRRPSSEWFDVTAAVAIEAVERAGELAKEAHAAAVAKKLQADHVRVSINHDLDTVLEQALAYYREHLNQPGDPEAPRIHARIREKHGPVGLEVFTTSITNRGSIYDRLANHPEALVAAEAKLAAALNELCAHYREARDLRRIMLRNQRKAA